MNRLARVMVLALLIPAAACEDKQAKEALQSAKEAGGKLSDMLAKGKDAVLTTAQEQGKNFDVVISDFKELASKKSGEAKTKLEESIASLEEMRASLKQKLEPLTNAQGEGWKEIAKEYDEVVAKMRRKIDEIRAEMRK